jgi:SOS-response transcriptional repressor LexA
MGYFKRIEHFLLIKDGSVMNKMDLTTRQCDIYNFIRISFVTRQQSPTIREIASHFMMSTKAAFDTLRALERKGWIERNVEKGKARSIKIPDIKIEFTAEPKIRKSILHTVALR